MNPDLCEKCGVGIEEAPDGCKDRECPLRCIPILPDDMECKAALHEESFGTLLQHAHKMLLDIPRIESDLIYAIAKLDDEERSAIILAYRNLFLDEK